MSLKKTPYVAGPCNQLSTIGPTQWLGSSFPYYGPQKKCLRQRSQPFRAFKSMGSIFLKKEAPAATSSPVQGVQEYGGHFSEKKMLAAT